MIFIHFELNNSRKIQFHVGLFPPPTPLNIKISSQKQRLCLLLKSLDFSEMEAILES